MKTIDTKKWSDFVFHHPQGNIFQTPEFYNIYKNTPGYEPVIIFIEKEDKIKGILLAVIQKEHSGFLGTFSARSIIIGGPLIADNNTNYLDEILNKYSSFIKGKAIYSQFRNLWDWSASKELFESNGFNYVPHLDILINTSDLNALEQGISKNKKRNIIKSKNKGVIFKEVTNEEAYNEALNLVYSTYKKIGLPCAPRDHFIAAYKELIPINRLKIFGAYYNDTMIGTRFELIFRDEIHDWYAGAIEKESNKYPNDFLIYNILIWSHEKGLKTFDFGGAGKPDQPYGVREHKLKFSNNLVEYGRFEVIHNRPLYFTGKIAIKAYKFLNDLRKKY